MGGTSFSTKGSAGAVANTAFMPPMPTKFTMAVPQQLGGSAYQGVQIVANIAANNVNLWSIFNPNRDTGSGTNAASCVLGASVTAPDGTATATHLIEAAMGGVSNLHRMQAAFTTQSANTNVVPLILRNAVIAKAAERTRIKLTTMALSMFTTSDGWGGNSAYGSSTVFDLAGGQIGVANTAFNNSGSPGLAPTAGTAGISPLGGGWYLCFMDTQLLTQSHVITSLDIDAGSGTGAANTNYVGDGTSGVNIWSSSILPAKAWGMGFTTPLFDDFITISTIDVNDTRQPEFNWYVHSVWPHPGFTTLDAGNTGAPAPPSNYSVSNSVLSMGPYNLAKLPLQTAYTTGVNSYGGRAFLPPALFEIRWSYDLPTSDHTFNNWHEAFWAQGTQLLTRSDSINDTWEIDFSEPAGYPNGFFTFINWVVGGEDLAQSAAWSAYPIWYSTWKYDESPPAGGANSQVALSGTNYTSLVANNLNNNPAGTVGVDWNTFNPGVTTQTFLDVTQMHTISCLILPPTHDDVGYCLNFSNGIPCCTTPGMSGGNSGYCLMSPLVPHFPGKVFADPLVVNVGSPGTGAGTAQVHVDWVRVTQ